MAQQPDTGLRSDLVDLSEVDFSLLDELPAGVLTNALRRVLRENSSGTDHFASFQNRI